MVFLAEARGLKAVCFYILHAAINICRVGASTLGIGEVGPAIAGISV